MTCNDFVAFCREVTRLREIFRAIREFVRKADMVLLALCVTATVFGIVVISSATNYIGNARYIRTQTLASGESCC